MERAGRNLWFPRAGAREGTSPRRSSKAGGGQMSRFIVALVAAWLLVPSLAQAAAPELSTTDKLKDRREVAGGDRARVLGFEDGGFYANGWHITGEMGGIWAQPIKL